MLSFTLFGSGCARLYSSSTTTSAFDYAVKLRAKLVNTSKVKNNDKDDQPIIKNPVDKSDGSVLPNKKTWSFAGLTDAEVVDFLAKNVIWDKYDIVALNKPYNVCCQEGGSISRGSVNLVAHLPALAARLNCPSLHVIHRLDRTSTGVLLLAKTELQAQHLKRCFKDRQIVKYYYCITRDVPNPPEGIIDIPLTDSALHADGKRRVALRPKAAELAASEVALPAVRQPPSMRGYVREAVTRYRVIDRFERCALVEVKPLTGMKHQIRAHLGYTLNTPVLGDHKYSSMQGKTLPQRLPEVTLERLGLRPAQARDLPIFLHAQRLEVPVEPGKPDGQVSIIKAPFPYQFVRTMRQLKLTPPFKLMFSKFI